ncbi:MAG: glycoside hydrolase family 2 [Chloroflexi bacterium]|nr:glycoside hydrolase family 2 [Chloroflexota bacterium]
MTDARPTHPRPQLTRENCEDLGGQWGFAYDDGDVGLKQGWMERAEPFDREITVPFPPESQASGIADPDEHPVVWYRRTVRADRPGAGQRLLLHFGAVDYRADVWVNGRHVCRHEGGHTPFTADITSVLGDGEQVIVLRAEDLPRDLTQPRGKQFWETTPRSIWYHRTTGIWQPVWLERVPETFIEEIRWTPDPDHGMLGMQVRLNEIPRRQLRLRLRLTLRGDVLTDDAYTVHRQETVRQVGLEPVVLNIGRRKLLWSPSHPNLVDARLTLETEAGEAIDVVESYVGLRSCGYQDGYFLLNGIPVYLRLVLGQGYWPESHLAGPSDDALRREVELIKSLGFNGVRVHQKVEDPRFLYWCDRLGLLVWSEMANAYVFSQLAVERLCREWMEVLRRNYNHPSIVTWVPLNESWGVPNLQGDPAQRAYVLSLYHLTHALDPTRPVIGNDGWEHLASDVWGIHDYALDGDSIRQRYGTPEALEQTLTKVRPLHHAVALPGRRREGEPVVLSECGGISYAPVPGTPWFGYGTVTDADSFLAKYDEIIGAIQDSPGIAGFCYTQLTDTEQETNGLLHADRTPKLDVGKVREINRRPSRSIPGDLVSAAQSAAQEVTSFGQGGSRL